MGLLNKFKDQGKKVFISLALGNALLGFGYTGENSTTDTTKKENTEETINKPSMEIRPEVYYFCEYVEAVKNGKNEEQAYREFALKMAKGNAKKMAQMQQKIEQLQQNQKQTREFLAMCLLIGGYLMMKRNLNSGINFIFSKTKKSKEPYKRSEIGFHVKD